MGIRISKAGVLDTIQDLGRNGFRNLGVNPNGAMDRTAIRLINLLLGNDEGEGAIEMHFPASEVVFEKETLFALGGANFSPSLNKAPIANWKLNTAKPGDSLTFESRLHGSRCYLAVKGGFKLPQWLGSVSTNLTAGVGGYEGRALQKGDRIIFRNSGFDEKATIELNMARGLVPAYESERPIRIIAGLDFRKLTALSEQILFRNDFAIAPDSNRMGFRLTGETLHLLSEVEMLSSAVEFGTVQLLPSGQLIVLMADHQTTGGYPKIGHVILKDLPRLAQKSVEDTIRFELISLAEAENLYYQFERDLSFLRMGVRFKTKTV